MAEEKTTTSVKVLSNFHEFAEIDKEGNTEVPNHLVRTYASLGTIELPEALRKEDEAASKKTSSTKEAK